MATTFMEPGGDATGDNSLFTVPGIIGGITAPSFVSDFVHGTHSQSIKFAGSVSMFRFFTGTQLNGRGSIYFYFNAVPGATDIILMTRSGAGPTAFAIQITSAGVVQLIGNATQIGSDGPTLSTGRWYRFSLAWNYTNTTTNAVAAFVDGTLFASGANVTLTATTINEGRFGNVGGNATLDLRASDIYTDNNSSLTDPGTVAGGLWVTAKRGFANGTTNGFTTQIGTGPVSGYGTGHAQQVNERPLNTANGWSMVGAGAAVTEEYTIEGPAVGDIDVSTATIVDIGGWVSCQALAAETGQLILGGVSHAISITTVNKLFAAYAGNTIYPAGGTDIGLITSTVLTTVSLYECGVLVAYIPASGAAVVPHRSAGGGASAGLFGSY